MAGERVLGRGDYNALGDKFDSSVSGIIDGLPTTSQGQLNVAEDRAFIQATATYDELPANFRTFVGVSGTALAQDRQFVCTTGTSVGGYGVIRSFRALPYKVGEGGECELSAIFAPPTALSFQFAGFFNIGDGAGFGYDGETPGVLYRHGGLAESRELQITAGAGGGESATVTINSVIYTIPITAGSVQLNAREITDYLNINATDWNVEQIDDKVCLIYAGDGAKSGTYSFSSASATGAWSQIKAGVTKTEDWIPQSAWNGIAVPTLNWQKGNVFKIVTGDMSYGDIQYYVKDPATRSFVLVHTLRFANTSTELLFGNPSMKIGMAIASLGSTTDLTMKCGGFSGFIQGKEVRIRNPRTHIETLAGLSPSANYTNLFTLRNRESINGYNNQIELQLLEITISTDSTKPIEFLLLANATVAGSPDFQELPGAGLVPIFDIDGTTVTGGRSLYSGEAGFFNLSDLLIRIPPTLELTIAVRVTSGSAADITGSLVWYEEI